MIVGWKNSVFYHLWGIGDEYICEINICAHRCSKRIIPYIFPPARSDRVSHPLILLPDQGGVGHHGQDARARRSQADGVPRAIGRCVLDEEGEGGDDAARVAEADDPGGADGALGVAVARQVEVHDVPADDDDGTGGKGGHGDEADAEVLRREVLAHGDQDGKPGHVSMLPSRMKGKRSHV